MSKRVVIPAPVRAMIAAAARASAPEEACGALLGRSDYRRNWEVCAVQVLPNRAANPEREFLIPSDTVRALERSAARSKSAVVGFFHSHSRGSAPSPTDIQRAWPGYVYLIADASAPGALSGWTLDHQRDVFLPVNVEPE